MSSTETAMDADFRPATNVKSAQKGWIIGALIISVGAIFVSGGLGMYQHNKAAALESKLEEQEKKLTEMKSTIDDSYKWLGFQAFVHNAEGFLVTDELVAEKVLLQYQSGSLKGVLDIHNQPATALKYKGQGKYDIPDRELKAMLLGLIDSLGSAYTSNFNGQQVPTWSGAEIQLTVQNYDLGTYKDGKITLKGE